VSVMVTSVPPMWEPRPGHWEGDLVFGRRMTTVGTLVEHSTRYVLLFCLPNGHTAEAVRTAMAKEIRSLPTELRRSLTWDQGPEMYEHVQFTIDTGIQVYFCVPKSPGSVAVMETPTACFASIYLRAPTSRR
jgi:transposase, IS30 family